MTEKELRKEIKGGMLRPCYIFAGEEEYLKRHACKLLKEAVLGDDGFEEFNYTVLSAKETDLAALEEAVSAMPFMSEKRLVIYNDYSFPSPKDEKRFEGVVSFFERIKEYTDSVLVIYGGEDLYDTSKRSKLFLRLAELEKLITLVTFDTQSQESLVKWANSHFAHEGVITSPSVCNALVMRTGKGMEGLANEISKLVSYVKAAGRNEVTEQDVERVSSQNDEMTAFAISNALLAQNAALAFQALSVLKNEKVRPTVILSEITSSYVNMHTVKSLYEAGMSYAEIGKKTGIHEYKVKLSHRAAERISYTRLEKIISMCNETERLLKGGRGDYIPIERLLSAVMSIKE